MTVRTATLQGIPASRSQVRGLLNNGDPMRTNTEGLASRAEKVAAIAAAYASAVDSESRFPAEAIAAAREYRLLGVAVPREFGGEGASVAEVADVCYALGRACASTAMIYAMHQTKVACVTRHGRSSAWHQLLMRRIRGEQMLLASSTTEGDNGGDIRNSTAPVERQGERIALERRATVISYGAAADAIVTTARRHMLPSISSTIPASAIAQSKLSFSPYFWYAERIPGAGFGTITAVSSSSGSTTANFVGLASGWTYKSLIATTRFPRFVETNSTLASRPSSATAADDGATAGHVP